MSHKYVQSDIFMSHKYVESDIFMSHKYVDFDIFNFSTKIVSKRGSGKKMHLTRND